MRIYLINLTEHLLVLHQNEKFYDKRRKVSSIIEKETNKQPSCKNFNHRMILYSILLVIIVGQKATTKGMQRGAKT